MQPLLNSKKTIQVGNLIKCGNVQGKGILVQGAVFEKKVRENTDEKLHLKAHPCFGALFFLGFLSSRIPLSCFLRCFFIIRSSPSFIF